MLANTPTAETRKRPAKYLPSVLVIMLMLWRAVEQPRQARRSELLMASISAAGGSTTTPPMIIHSPTPIAPNSIPYWTSAMAGVFTVITEQANPAMRRPNTATIDPPIEKLRLCRVVRGVPRKANVRTAKAKGSDRRHERGHAIPRRTARTIA